jgi:glutamyl-tRNA synthetase
VSIDEGTEKLIKVIALKNAIEHGGKAQIDAVISKLMGSRPEYRAKIKQIVADMSALVREVNSMTLEAQRALMADLAPEQGSKEKEKEKEKERHDASQPHLPPLEGAVGGQVVTRFPPEPNGYPHIGHAKAAIIDEEYARMYSGRLVLRFDDTNPLKEKAEYYDAIRDGLEWLGVRPDLEKNTSDDISLLHSYGRKLIEAEGAYVCTCSTDRIHDLRGKGLPCECRSESTDMLERADKIFGGSYRQNEAIIRFKGDMSDPNTAMRDPTLFRIIEGNHPLLGDKVTLWPTYDFAAPIEDSHDGVTHAMRTKEYELRNELYFAILDRLQLRKPRMLEFSRLEFDGLPVSKRKITPLVQEGILSGWDDPRLPTLAALRRRGFVPQAIRRFVLSLGLTLADTKPPFETLEAFNRKIIDPLCMRLYFVPDPVEVKVLNVTPAKAVLKNHPVLDLGSRTVGVYDSVYISGKDAEGLKAGDVLRLMELYNIRISSTADLKSGSKSDPDSSESAYSPEKHEPREQKTASAPRVIVAEYAGNEVVQSMPKVQWVAKGDEVPFKVLVPKQLYVGEEYNKNSLEVIQGFAESFVSALKRGTEIQLVRFGFCSIDSSNSAILTHR